MLMMFSMEAYFWLIVGGLLEPVWVLAMKKSNNFKDRPWTVITVILVIASPLCLSLAMREVSVGTAYAVWTGIGAIGTVILGYFLYKERIKLWGIFFISLIIIGSVGLALGGI
ncbi:MAG: multidrug efflux SMR transporter [Candidatus Methanoplasma sp.]|jgi:quaternary ammonium compound-resistance protein SugE|nr:multidrug efflux SMR transporter [Candidatus Methanoplasma sp.]